RLGPGVAEGGSDTPCADQIAAALRVTVAVALAKVAGARRRTELPVGADLVLVECRTVGQGWQNAHVPAFWLSSSKTPIGAAEQPPAAMSIEVAISLP